ncbi:DUF4123 domain-containing protein [uncultured Litoreibacter sp.]|uniref:DUF4123 domain-containing protein n=1 Tax=uncultured Litoreibacter sp. TaxID=1392394 RepID=UPI0026319DF5|nr:DUF4123 domain-containing protein [uncultured Litoreibacter sp.]
MHDQISDVEEPREAEFRLPLHHVILEALAPFGSELAQDPTWPEALLPVATNATLYALIDAARQPFLVETLGASSAKHRCLFSGDTQTELEDVAPWLVALDPSEVFTRNLFTQNDAQFHLWDHSPGVLIRSDASFDHIWHWCRKLLWVRDKYDKRFFLRWWDPKCFEITYPILKGLDAQLRRREFKVEAIVPRAWMAQT